MGSETVRRADKLKVSFINLLGEKYYLLAKKNTAYKLSEYDASLFPAATRSCVNAVWSVVWTARRIGMDLAFSRLARVVGTRGLCSAGD